VLECHLGWPCHLKYTAVQICAMTVGAYYQAGLDCRQLVAYRTLALLCRWMPSPIVPSAATVLIIMEFVTVMHC